jgi:DNA-binding winged helix-turn-helix (wHTH) protein
MAYHFGRFTVDADTRQLLRDGEEMHITPKAFELLDLLLANRVRAVSKAELQERMWPSTFVEQTNLATLIGEIRRVLSDTSGNPKFVRTLYSFGYRFVGQVTVDGDTPCTERPPARLWLLFEARQIPLMEGVNIIGRAPDAAIQIDSPGISRYHARIVVAQGEATLEDMSSKNGTVLNGKQISAPTPLADDSEIRLGSIVLTFRTRSPISATESMPAGDA